MPGKLEKARQESREATIKQEESEKFTGSTTRMANLLGVNKAQARDVLTMVQAEGKTVSDVQVEKAESAELGSTGLEMLAEVVHSVADPLTAVATSAGMTSVKDDVKEPEPIMNPAALPMPKPEGRAEKKAEDEPGHGPVATSEPAEPAPSNYTTPTPFNMTLSRMR